MHTDSRPNPGACCYWLTGLSGAGKSTLAHRFHDGLQRQGVRAYVLDGDRLRTGLNRDLGFSRADRAENVRRIAEVARLMVDAGLVVLVGVISPYREQRELARSLFAPGTFFEVFVDTPLQVCMARDPKGLYRRALAGELPGMTGIDDPYEAPQAADLVIASGETAPQQCCDQLLRHYAEHVQRKAIPGA